MADAKAVTAHDTAASAGSVGGPTSAAPPSVPTYGVRGARLAFTPEGRIFVLMTLAIGAAAVNTGNNLLYLVLGLMLSLIILSGSLSDLVLWGIGARRHLPRRAFAGAPCLVELELTNVKRWLPSFSLAASDLTEQEATQAGEKARKPVAAAVARAYYLKIDPRSSQRAGYLRVPTRRGRLRLARVRLATRYPFGFFDKARLLPCEDELLVFPAVVPIPDLERRLERLLGEDDARAAARRRPLTQGVEIAGLRPYRGGDEARAIHWRRSAALGSLVVRELERDPGRELAIRLVLPPGEPTSSAPGLERVISRAASLAIVAHERGATVEILVPGGRSPRVAENDAIDPLLAYLALLEPAPGAPVPAPRRDASVIDVEDPDAGVLDRPVVPAEGVR